MRKKDLLRKNYKNIHLIKKKKTFSGDSNGKSGTFQFCISDIYKDNRQSRNKMLCVFLKKQTTAGRFNFIPTSRDSSLFKY